MAIVLLVAFNAVLLLLLNGLATLLAIGLAIQTRKAFAPVRQAQDLPKPTTIPSVSVIIPAYNEAENLEDCVRSVLNSTTLPAETLEVIVLDDRSTDETAAIAQALQSSGDPRLKVWTGQPRPAGNWVGKNWACVQAVQQAQGEFLLFIDADVRLKPGAIERSVGLMAEAKLDLLSCAPELVCGCLAEWLVQPLMISILTLGYDLAEINDPQSETAFAAGPFMLFRRSAYEQIGGHLAVAAEVVEDVELARRIKQAGLQLRYIPGVALASLRMYRSTAALWEGWTKNFYVGAQRNLVGVLLIALIFLLVCTLPDATLAIAPLLWLAGAPSWTSGLAIGCALLTIGLHYDIRRTMAQAANLPTRYWWLTGLGGLAVAAIILGSVIKTETGWGWTWRGRSLRSEA